MKVTIAQLNPVVGDLHLNFLKLRQALEYAAKDGSDLLVLPELFLVGYPPRDLLEMPWFIKQIEESLQELLALSAEHSETGILLGLPRPGQEAGKGLCNSALLLQGGRILFRQDKSLLPTYDVFDETRYFDPASAVELVSFKGQNLGISICEDAWNDSEFWPRQMYNRDPVSELAHRGATLLINISASPFQIGKEETRYQLLSSHARRHRLPFIYVNQVGANDELIFDGRSMVLDRTGQVLWLGEAFEECLYTIDFANPGTGFDYAAQGRTESVYRALVLGIRDYIRKCGFKKAVLGLSGGIDSAVTACLAVAALGPQNVLGLSMPSPYSSTGSIEDSRQLAENLGMEFKVLPISGILAAYQEIIHAQWQPCGIDLTEENIQARIRGNLLMAFSNRLGYLVLSTGNKSELAVGYCTLYGDMSGGLSVLSDLPKHLVYEVSHYINRAGQVIPGAIMVKAPSAELRPDQKDQDSLPPYEILDEILHYYVEERLSATELVKKGYSAETVDWVILQVDRSEYKRRQAAPGLKVSSKAFGPGRRMPVAAHWEHVF